MRTLDEFFNRMIVVDRRLAMIPGPSGDNVAIAVQEPALVAYLVDVFERAWERARPFTNTERSMMNDIAREQRAMTIRMLIEGHSDPVSAKRLGVSARTFAGYVADLKSEYDADTRFQLGYTMGQMRRLRPRGGVTLLTPGPRTDDTRPGRDATREEISRVAVGFDGSRRVGVGSGSGPLTSGSGPAQRPPP